MKTGVVQDLTSIKKSELEKYIYNAFIQLYAWCAFFVLVRLKVCYKFMCLKLR